MLNRTDEMIDPMSTPAGKSNGDGVAGSGGDGGHEKSSEAHDIEDYCCCFSTG